ncbi:MAG TPA: hypothetical protein VL863_04845 [bacterium]|nr:hypothetical protein [bacterium]
MAVVFSADAADSFGPPSANPTARVVLVQGQNLLNAFLSNDERVEEAFNRGLLALTRTTNAPAAWLSLVKTNDVVGIKVFSLPGPLCGTRPAVVAAIVHGLRAAGLPGTNIIIWDKHSYDLRAAGFYQLGEQLGVRVAGAAESGYDANTFYLPDAPVTGSLVWGDLEFGQKGDGIGKKSFVSKLVSQQMTKIISVAPVINQNDAGLCGHFYSLTLGSVDNTRRFEGDPDRLAVALPEIYALRSVGDHVVLLVTDALLAQYQGGPSSFLQYATELDQLWLGHDPVALDTLSLKELARERKKFIMPPLPANFQIYTNAVLLQLGVNDPSRIQIEKVQ